MTLRCRRYNLCLNPLEFSDHITCKFATNSVQTSAEQCEQYVFTESNSCNNSHLIHRAGTCAEPLSVDSSRWSYMTLPRPS